VVWRHETSSFQREKKALWGGRKTQNPASGWKKVSGRGKNPFDLDFGQERGTRAITNKLMAHPGELRVEEGEHVRIEKNTFGNRKSRGEMIPKKPAATVGGEEREDLSAVVIVSKLVEEKG